MPYVIKLYNTLSRDIEEFKPLTPGYVRIYVCGITPYDYTHLGHARTFVFFDALKRYFNLRGYHTLHVMNITDIDDKIIRRANETGRDWREVSETYIKDYMDALERLNVRVDLHPRVTEHISDIIKFIQVLIDKGYAYVARSGSVYFDVDKYGDYGRLSNRMDKSTWSQEQEFIHEKKNPFDFALWKARKPGEPYWDSPWGQGRPGWHIECSVMSTKYLGERFDIHGGGNDLIFPHHENERAQSESALNVSLWVKYWIHTGMLMIGGEKMSKSFGNIISLKEAFNKWDPMVIRLWYLASHYRKPQVFTEDSVEAVSRMYDRMAATVETLKKLLREQLNPYRASDGDVEVLHRLLSTREAFHKALSNDFNTPEALSAVNDYLVIVNREVLSRDSYILAETSYRLIQEYNFVLGVLDKHLYGLSNEAESKIDRLIKIIVDVRRELRERKMYEITDRIRAELEKEGVILMDKGLETTWVKKRI